MTASIKLAILSSIFGITFLLGRAITEGNWLVLGGIIAVLSLALIVSNLEYGLILIVFSMLLSPEIQVAEVPGRAVVIRFEDLLIPVLLICFLVWKMKYGHEPLFVTTPVLLPIFCYTLIAIISTMLGIAEGRLSPARSFFFLLKYIQYFILYFLVINVVRDENTIKRLLIAGAITCAIVCVYGYSLIGKVDRIYAPFDVDPRTGAGEAGTLGGYLLLTMSQALAFFCYAKSMNLSLFFLGFFIFMLPVLAYTLSHASFFGFVPMLLTVLLLTERKKALLTMTILCFSILIPIVFKAPTEDVRGRIMETFAGPELGPAERILWFNVREMSALARIHNWRLAFTRWIPDRPLLGHGVPGVGLVDAQFPLLLGEVGLMGFSCFLWLLYTIFKTAFNVFKSTTNPIFKSVSLGLIAGLIGLIFQSVAVNTFIIIRIMEPFWFLVGLVSLMPFIKQSKESQTTTSQTF